MVVIAVVKAQASYRVIIQKFGDIRPFINIVEAEGRHIQALLPLFEKYEFDVPEDTWARRVEAPENILQACQIGVEAEIDNADLYNKLLADTLVLYITSCHRCLTTRVTHHSVPYCSLGFICQ